MNGEKLKHSLYLEIYNSRNIEPIPKLTYNKRLMSTRVLELGIWQCSQLWLCRDVNVHPMKTSASSTGWPRD